MTMTHRAMVLEWGILMRKPTIETAVLCGILRLTPGGCVCHMLLRGRL